MLCRVIARYHKNKVTQKQWLRNEIKEKSIFLKKSWRKIWWFQLKALPLQRVKEHTTLFNLLNYKSLWQKQ